MAVAFDAVANLGTGNTSAGVSGNFTLNASATLLVVWVGGYLSGLGYSALTSVSVTVGSGNTPLKLQASANCANTAGNGWVQLFTLLNPPTGTQPISVKLADGTTYPFLNVTVASFKGVGQLGNAVTNTGTAAAATTGSAVSSATGNLVVTAFAGLDSTLTLTGSGTQLSNMPATATANYVTLQAQDVAGATSVSPTATFSGSTGWAGVSLNLIAGTPWQVGATLALTATPTLTTKVTGRVWNIGATLAMTATATASVLDSTLGPPLRYVGRTPDTDSVIVPASYAGPGTNSDFANTVVTPAWLTQQITNASQFLVTSAWIQSQINGTGNTPVYPSQTSISTALAAYLPTTKLGQPNGIAQLNSSAQIPAAQLPTLTTNSVALGYDCHNNGTVFLAPGNFYETTTNNIGEFVLANIVVPDPGYPWIALVSAMVEGYSAGGTQPTGSRLIGTGNYGLLTVTIDNGRGTPNTSPVYAAGLCTDDPLPNFYTVSPGCLSVGNITPLTQPPLVGGATLDLAGCNWEGSGYTFGGTGLVFSVLVIPGLS